MSKSLLQTANTTSQVVAVEGIINPGSAIRRYGCNNRVNGNAIELDGSGYYTIVATIVATPTAIGNVTAEMRFNGERIPGATSTSSVSTVDNATTLTINTTVRLCCCPSTGNLTLVLTAGASTINNVSVTVVKE